MPEPSRPGPSSTELPDAVRRRLDEVFGDVLPSTTGDEREAGSQPDTDAEDAALLADRPPHHDRAD